MAELGWWDRFLIGVAPGWGVRRIHARAQAAMLARHFDAATTSRRTSGWSRRATDANSAAATSLPALRELSRDLRRNNGWARRIVQVIGNNTVGWGIEGRAVGADAVAKRASEIWKAWAESSSCDYDGAMGFAGLQRLVLDTVVESGEALVVRDAANADDGLPVPVRVRVLEPDYLDSYKDGVEGTVRGSVIVQGVELLRGRRIAYWLHQQHPGATGMGQVGSRRVPAEDVIHVRLVERAGQVRGVPWLAAAIAKLNDFDDYDDAVLMQQKIAACFGAFVTDMDGSATALGEQDADDEHLETLEPGHIEYLPPGKQVSFAQPPSTSDHGGYSSTSLRRIAASAGITYEELTGDFSQVNFSSARMARLAHWANVHVWRWNMMVPQLCDGVWNWVIGMAAQLEGWQTTPVAKWSPPPMPMLEPEKEGLAIQRLVRSGAKTISQVLLELGEDPDTHFAEYAADLAKLDALGIVLDSDARRVSAAGLAQANDPGGGNSKA